MKEIKQMTDEEIIKFLQNMAPGSKVFGPLTRSQRERIATEAKDREAKKMKPLDLAPH